MPQRAPDPMRRLASSFIEAFSSAMTERGRKILGLLAWMLVTFAAAAAGAVASAEAGEFYQQLERPEWAPPAWLFGPVWTLLYVLMALAAWRVWSAAGWRGAAMPLSLYLAQLALNALWTWLFFAWRLGAVAFAEVVVLWLLIAATAWTFWRVRWTAGAMLVPYLLWVSYAAALNWSLWQRNPAWLT